MLEQQESLRGSLRAAKLYEGAPNGLERKIKRNMANINSDGQWSWVPIFRWIAASAAIILLVAITYLGGEKFLTGPSGTEQAAQTELVGSIIDEVNAFADLIPDLLRQVDSVAGDRLITRAELKRDIGYSDSAIRLLEKTGQLSVVRTHGGRRQYKLAQVLAFRILQPGLKYASRIHTVRKHVNITTVNREFWKRITDRTPQCANPS